MDEKVFNEFLKKIIKGEMPFICENLYEYQINKITKEVQKHISDSNKYEAYKYIKQLELKRIYTSLDDFIK